MTAKKKTEQAPPADKPEEQPIEEPTEETVEKTTIVAVDPTDLYGEEISHIDPNSKREQVIVRVPRMNWLAEMRNKAFIAFVSIFGSRDTNGHVHCNFRDAVLWGGVEPKFLNKDGISLGKAVVLTAGKRPPNNCFWRDTNGKEIPYRSAGGGFEMTNETLILLFATDEVTLGDFEAEGAPATMVIEELKAKLTRSRADRLQREARDNRSEQAKKKQEGRQADQITYPNKEKPGEFDM